MSSQLTRILAAICGVAGTVILIGSFMINPAPPPGATISQLADFANQHSFTIILGGWMQGMGSLLTVLFAIALVHIAGATNRFAGWVTLLSGSALLMVSLTEVAFYLAAVQAARDGDAALGSISNSLIQAVQHVFLVAPALLLPLGVVILGSSVLPRLFGYVALVLGTVLQALGLVGLFTPLQALIDVLLIVQGVWFIAAAVALVVPWRARVGARAGRIAGEQRAV
jgi:hypothetical protein